MAILLGIVTIILQAVFIGGYADSLIDLRTMADLIAVSALGTTIAMLVIRNPGWSGWFFAVAFAGVGVGNLAFALQ